MKDFFTLVLLSCISKIFHATEYVYCRLQSPKEEIIIIFFEKMPAKQLHRHITLKKDLGNQPTLQHFLTPLPPHQPEVVFHPY